MFFIIAFIISRREISGKITIAIILFFACALFNYPCSYIHTHTLTDTLARNRRRKNSWERRATDSDSDSPLLATGQSIGSFAGAHKTGENKSISKEMVERTSKRQSCWWQPIGDEPLPSWLDVDVTLLDAALSLSISRSIRSLYHSLPSFRSVSGSHYCTENLRSLLPAVDFFKK